MTQTHILPPPRETDNGLETLVSRDGKTQVEIISGRVVVYTNIHDVEVKSAKASNDNAAAAPAPKSALVLSGTSDEWKAEIKAKIAAKEIKAGDEVTDNAGRAWIYVEHLKSGKDFFAAKEDYVGEGGKEKFDHYDALEIAKKAGAQLMNLETGMISYKAFKKGILQNFKTDASYWLSDLCDTYNARTQWFDDGTQRSIFRDRLRRVRLALEL